MSEPDPVGSQSLWVVLARMEGKIDMVAERLMNTIRTVEQHSEDIGVLKSGQQRLSEQAVARDATAVALAAALKEAEEQRRSKSDTAWTPPARVLAVVAAVCGLITTWALTFK